MIRINSFYVSSICFMSNFQFDIRYCCMAFIGKEKYSMRTKFIFMIAKKSNAEKLDILDSYILPLEIMQNPPYENMIFEIGTGYPPSAILNIKNGKISLTIKDETPAHEEISFSEDIRIEGISI